MQFTFAAAALLFSTAVLALPLQGSGELEGFISTHPAAPAFPAVPAAPAAPAAPALDKRLIAAEGHGTIDARHPGKKLAVVVVVEAKITEVQVAVHAHLEIIKALLIKPVTPAILAEIHVHIKAIVVILKASVKVLLPILTGSVHALAVGEVDILTAQLNVFLSLIVEIKVVLEALVVAVGVDAVAVIASDLYIILGLTNTLTVKITAFAVILAGKVSANVSAEIVVKVLAIIKEININIGVIVAPAGILVKAILAVCLDCTVGGLLNIDLSVGGLLGGAPHTGPGGPPSGPPTGPPAGGDYGY